MSGPHDRSSSLESWSLRFSSWPPKSFASLVTTTTKLLNLVPSRLHDSDRFTVVRSRRLIQDWDATLLISRHRGCSRRQ